MIDNHPKIINPSKVILENEHNDYIRNIKIFDGLSFDIGLKSFITCSLMDSDMLLLGGLDGVLKVFTIKSDTDIFNNLYKTINIGLWIFDMIIFKGSLLLSCDEGYLIKIDLDNFTILDKIQTKEYDWLRTMHRFGNELILTGSNYILVYDEEVRYLSSHKSPYIDRSIIYNNILICGGERNIYFYKIYIKMDMTGIYNSMVLVNTTSDLFPNKIKSLNIYNSDLIASGLDCDKIVVINLKDYNVKYIFDNISSCANLLFNNYLFVAGKKYFYILNIKEGYKTVKKIKHKKNEYKFCLNIIGSSLIFYSNHVYSYRINIPSNDNIEYLNDKLIYKIRDYSGYYNN